MPGDAKACDMHEFEFSSYGKVIVLSDGIYYPPEQHPQQDGSEEKEK